MEWFSIRGNTQQNMAQVLENKFFFKVNTEQLTTK